MDDFPEDLAIRVRGVGKTYRLGVISRRTLRDELLYRWAKLRGRDPRESMGRIGGRELADPGLFHALDDVSFDIRKGETVGLIGRNGAGKSTMLKILARITTPSTGEAWIRGRVGSMLEVGTGFHPELTGRENIYLNGTILGMSKKEIDAKFDEIVEFSEIGDFLDTPVKRYSSGMYVKLAFSIASSLDNDVLLLDEVLAVGDAAFRRKSLARMKEIAASGRTILFVSHSLSDVKTICSRCIWFDGGRIVRDGLSEDVLDDYEQRSLSGGTGSSVRLSVARGESVSSDEAELKGVDVSLDPDGGPVRFSVRYETHGVRYRNPSEETNRLSASGQWGWPRVLLSVFSRFDASRPLFTLDSDCVEGALPQWIPASGMIRVSLPPDFRLAPGPYSADVVLCQGRRPMLTIPDAVRFTIGDSAPPFGWRRTPARPGTVWLAHSWEVVPDGPGKNGENGNA